MAKVTSKYQVTVPKAIADEFKIRPGDDTEWVAAGDLIRVIPPNKRAGVEDTDSGFGYSTRRQNGCGGARRGVRANVRATGEGEGRISTLVAALIDTNVLVYRFDSRFPEKQRIATQILRSGIEEDSVVSLIKQ